MWQRGTEADANDPTKKILECETDSRHKSRTVCLKDLTETDRVTM